MAAETPHPLIDAVAHSLRRQPGAGLCLPPPVLDELQRATDELDDGVELMAIVESAMRLAYVLAEEQSSPGAARALLEASGPALLRLQQRARTDAAAMRLRVETVGAEHRKQHNALASHSGPGLAVPSVGGVQSGGPAEEDP